MADQRFSYGGQAVIEGVMIRGKRQATVAVYRPTGEVAYKHFLLNEQRRTRWEGIPLLRGLVTLWDMLILGTRALNFSASASMGEQEEPSSAATIPSMLLALVLAIGFFFILPLLLANLVGYLGASSFVREILEGMVRIGFIVGYMLAISRIPEIQRVFGYHGAEHKVVNAYEAGIPLTVKTVRGCSLIHPRCGTGFLVIVVLISFVLFFFLGGLSFWARLLSRMVLVPLIAALSYEVLRVVAAFYHLAWVRALVAPSLILQQLTTREPDDKMIAVAIAVLQSVLAADGIKTHRTVSGDDPVLVASM